MFVKNQKKLILFIVLGTIFGLAGGVLGEILTRVYILEKAFNVPLVADLNLKNNSYEDSGLIIRNPNKVIVEQSVKINEVLNSVSKSIFGIFEYKKNIDNKNVLSVDDFYILNQELGQAFLLTADGWAISSFFAPELKSKTTISTSSRELIAKKYFFIGSDKKIYKIDNVKFSANHKFLFWHIKSKDMPVQKFSYLRDLKNGELLLAVNWDKWVQINFLSAKISKSIFNNSLSKNQELILNEKINPDFYNGFLFDLNGGFVALILGEKNMLYADDIYLSLDKLVKKKKIKNLEFGAPYIELSNMVYAGKNKPTYSNGALLDWGDESFSIKKGSLADVYGFVRGDLIISVNDVLIDEENHFADLLNKYSTEKTLNIKFIRNSKKQSLKIDLSNFFDK